MIKCAETQFKAWKQKSSFQLIPELCSRQVLHLEVVQMGAGGTWAARRDISSTQKQRREEVLQQKQQRQLLVCRLRVWVPNKALLGSVGTAIANRAQVPGVC